MSLSASRLCKMIVEMPDGSVIEGMIIAAEISVNEHVGQLLDVGRAHVLGGFVPDSLMPKSWSAHLKGELSTLKMSARHEAVIDFGAKQTSIEWKCDYCDAVMARKHRACTKCGSSRSFLYG